MKAVAKIPVWVPWLAAVLAMGGTMVLVLVWVNMASAEGMVLVPSGTGLLAHPAHLVLAIGVVLFAVQAPVAAAAGTLALFERAGVDTRLTKD